MARPQDTAGLRARPQEYSPRNHALNPFRPATLVVALSLAFAADLSGAADAASAAAMTPAAATPAALGSGLDKPGMDAGVRPQDSLFSAMNGTWLKKTPIPADKSDYGTFTQLD